MSSQNSRVPEGKTSPSEFHFRKVQPSDLPALLQLMKAHAAHEDATWNDALLPAHWEPLLFTDVPKIHGYLIEINASAEGYFTYTIDYSTWQAAAYLHMDCLYLNPQWRGKRIGDAVLRFLQAVATQQNSSGLQWQTPVSNASAIRFYQRNGAVGKEKIRFFLDV